MPTFIMLSTLTPEGVQTVKNNPQRIREVNTEVEQLGATVKAQWSVLGRFDFVNDRRGARRDHDGARVARAGLARARAASRRSARSRSTTSSRRSSPRRLREGPRRRRRRARARARQRARPLAAAAGAARGARQPRHRGRSRGASRRSRSTTSTASSSWRSPRASTSWWSAPRRRWSRASPTGSSGPASRTSARAPPRRSWRAPRRSPRRSCRARACRPRTGAEVETVDAGMEAIDGRYPAVIKFDGLAAGKGVVIAPDEAAARAGADRDARGAPLRRRPGRRRGVPRRRGALAVRDLRRRARGPDGPRAGLQADLRRRRGAEHRRHGRLLAGRRRAGLRRARRGDPPAGGRPAARARHAVSRRALRGADAHRRRPAGHRVQRALRRPRDPGRAAAAAQRPAGDAGAPPRAPAAWPRATPWPSPTTGR